MYTTDEETKTEVKPVIKFGQMILKSIELHSCGVCLHLTDHKRSAIDFPDQILMLIEWSNQEKNPVKE